MLSFREEKLSLSLFLPNNFFLKNNIHWELSLRDKYRTRFQPFVIGSTGKKRIKVSNPKNK